MPERGTRSGARPGSSTVLPPWARQHVAFLGAPGVIYEELRPPPELAAWVAVRWRIRSEVQVELRILPDGCMDLIHGEVIGPFTRPVTVAFSPGDVAEGLRFHPGGFPALSGVPASELVDLRAPICEVAPGGRSLRQLAADAAPPDPIARATQELRDLDEVSRQSGYSQRQVRRRVIAATGHAPKRLVRIARMQAVLKAGRGESWARTAAEHGYYDEAHMANDIRELAGATPHSLLT